MGILLNNIMVIKLFFRYSEFSNKCIVIQQQSMAAHNRDTYYPKVIKALAKEVVVDK
jgi:hypothetical protein